MVLGLREQNRSNYARTARLRANADGTTTVYVFLASGLTSGGAEADQGARADEVVALEGGVPAPGEVTGIVIADGGFGGEGLTLREGVPTVMRVAIVDDRDYRLRIGDLVPPTPLPAGEVTVIEFTTPTAATYEEQLLAADGDEELAAVPVAVCPASELAP